MLAAIFSTNLAGVHVIRPLRILLFLFGIALAAISLDIAGIVNMRAHFVSYSEAYVRGLHASMLIATGAAVLAAYVYFVSLGTWTNWPTTTNYYDRLAAAFHSGHLYVKEAPDPALLALANPYDPDARRGITSLVAHSPDSIWDMSMYRGRVYLYWGPAPALLILALKTLVPVVLGDQQLTFAFLAGAFLFETLVLARLRRRFFADLPAWTVAAGMLVLGLGNPVPWLLFSPRIYEAAIAAGQFFFMGGLYFALSGLDRDPVSYWRLALGALAWACAVGSRATLAIAVAYLAIAVLLRLLWMEHGREPRVALTAIAYFAIPLLLGAALLAWYNYARFGSMFEFGFRYAITMLDQNKYHQVLFSPLYLGPNAYLYLLNPPVLSGQFPFFRPVWNGAVVMSFNDHFHAIYNAERIIGLIYVAPLLVLGVIPSAEALLRALRRPRPQPDLPTEGAQLRAEHFFRWLVLTLSGLALTQLIVVLLVFYSTMRYFLDVAPTLAILSMVGFWLGYRAVTSRPWLLVPYVLVGIGLILFTVIMGILIGFSSDVSRLRAANPSLLPHARLFFISLARQIGRIFAPGG